MKPSTHPENTNLNSYEILDPEFTYLCLFLVSSK